MPETPATVPPAPPQIVYVQVPAPAAPVPLTPVQQAQLDNTAAWRTTGIISILLLITFFFAWVIPLLLLVVLVANNNRMARARQDMARGITRSEGPGDDNTDQARWVLAAFTAVIGLLCLAVVVFGSGTVTAALVGLGLLGVAAAVAPVSWREIVERAR